MHPPRLSLILALFVIPLSKLFGDSPQPDYTFIDDYLTRWDQFAQGNNGLGPGLGEDRTRFLDELTQSLNSGDRRAMSRVVFFAVVQVGGFIPLESPLGEALQKTLGSQVAIFTSEKTGEKSYFAGRLYFWWELHKKDYASFPLYDEYMKRDFAKRVVIPMYTAAVKNHPH